MQHYRFTLTSLLRVLHLCVVMCASIMLQAQQFKMVRTQGAGIYQGGGVMEMAQVVSITHLGGNDTAFAFYTVVDSLPGVVAPCVLSASATSWLGERMEVGGSVDNYFFNQQGDTLFFRPGETNGYSYRMYTYPDGRYLQATQTNDQFVDIIGTIDRVKTFTLEERDAGGAVVPSVWNGKTFAFTERYGFSTIYNLWQFPADTTTYSLIGFTSPPLGQRLLNAFSVFDLRKGYELHYTDRVDDAIDNIQYTTLEKRLVLDVAADVTTDTLWFTQERLRWTITETVSGSDTTFIVDTILDTVALSAYTFLNGNHRQLFAFAPGRYGYSRHYTSDTTGPIFRKEVHRPYTLDATNICLIPAADTILREVYGDGLGITEWLDSTDIRRHHRLLVYAQQGVRRWGTPINFDRLLSAHKPAQDRMQLMPNPGHHGFYVQGVDVPATLIIRQLSGQPVTTLLWQPGMFTDVNTLPAGLYLVEIRSAELAWYKTWVKH